MTPYEQLEEARIALNLKKQEAADYLGINNQHYSRLKKAGDRVPVSYIIALRAAAGLDFPQPPKPTFKGYQKTADKAERSTPKKEHIPSDRAMRMRDLYVNGLILEEIGAQFGITRERVRQILAKEFGFTRKDGGKTFNAARAKKKRERAKDEKTMRKYGCTWEQYKAVIQIGKEMMATGLARERTPTGAFSQQRCSARQRGIDWQMNFWQWWTIWQKSGKWAKRGRGGYVMCRKGDEGPYHPDNVYIATSAQNIYDGLNKSGLPMGVQQQRNGKYSASRHINGKDTYLGAFDTPEEAHLAFLKAPYAEKSEAA